MYSLSSEGKKRPVELCHLVHLNVPSPAIREFSVFNCLYGVLQKRLFEC